MRAVEGNEWVGFAEAGGRRSFVSILTGEKRDELPAGATATAAARSIAEAVAEEDPALVEARRAADAARAEEKREQRWL